ncbi:MAG: hypothetical protein LBH81_02475 [Rickettsiales bacterium]|jgi:hypothetical protein|nr:hypothetical protein [Rickettsiales bacterium]
MKHHGGIVAYSDNTAVQKILQGLDLTLAEKNSPLVDIVVSNKSAGGTLAIKIPATPMSGPVLMGKIISALGGAETALMAKLKIKTASWHGRRILVWLAQAGGKGLSPLELEARLGGGEAARNTLRTTVHSLRKNAGAREIILFENGVYKIAQV